MKPKFDQQAKDLAPLRMGQTVQNKDHVSKNVGHTWLLYSVRHQIFPIPTPQTKASRTRTCEGQGHLNLFSQLNNTYSSYFSKCPPSMASMASILGLKDETERQQTKRISYDPPRMRR